MSAMEPLCHLFGVSTSTFSRKENLFLETILFMCIYEELKEIFEKQNKEYFHLKKLTIKKEDLMIEKYLICLMIKDILSTEEYTLERCGALC